MTLPLQNALTMASVLCGGKKKSDYRKTADLISLSFLIVALSLLASCRERFKDQAKSLATKASGLSFEAISSESAAKTAGSEF